MRRAMLQSLCRLQSKTFATSFLDLDTSSNYFSLNILCSFTVLRHRLRFLETSTASPLHLSHTFINVLFLLRGKQVLPCSLSTQGFLLKLHPSLEHVCGGRADFCVHLLASQQKVSGLFFIPFPKLLSTDNIIALPQNEHVQAWQALHIDLGVPQSSKLKHSNATSPHHLHECETLAVAPSDFPTSFFLRKGFETLADVSLHFFLQSGQADPM